MYPILEKCQKLVDKLVGQSNCKHSSDSLRLNHYIGLAVISIPLSTLFIIINILNAHYHIAISVTVLLFCMFFSLILIPKIKQLTYIFHANNCVFITMLILLSFWGDKSSGQILWCYVYPILSIFLFGNKIGIKWSLFLLFAILTSLFFNNNIDLKYTNAFEIRFSIIYLTVLSITSWLEHSRMRYIEVVQQQRLELEKERGSLQQEITRRTYLEEELNKLANQDSLTGMHNRRHLFNRASEELFRSQRYDTPFAMALVDLDNFKNINDKYGHPAGDEVIKSFAKQCQSLLRKSNISGRIGGDEFAILLLHVSPKQALKIMENFRQKINEHLFFSEGEVIRVTISIGLSMAGDQNNSIESLYAAADKALYSSKHKGRNRVELAQEQEQ